MDPQRFTATFRRVCHLSTVAPYSCISVTTLLYKLSSGQHSYITCALDGTLQETVGLSSLFISIIHCLLPCPLQRNSLKWFSVMFVFSGRIRWLHKSTHEEGWGVSKVCIQLWAFDILRENWTAAGNLFLIMWKDFSFTYTHLNEGMSVATTMFSLLLTEQGCPLWLLQMSYCIGISVTVMSIQCWTLLQHAKIPQGPKLPTEFNFNFMLMDKVWFDSCQKQGIVVYWKCPDWLWGPVGNGYCFDGGKAGGMWRWLSISVCCEN
jgi:hypothetical protein